jgi:hypothetical protein
VPLRFERGTLVIGEARLESRAVGVVRYRPETPPAALLAGGEGAALMLKALDNFNYAAIAMTVSGRVGGDIDVGLSIKGANPDVYEGYPVELNLNISGELDQIVERSLQGYRIPDKVRERLKAFGVPAPAH